MEIGQQILSGTSPPNNHDSKNNLNELPVKRVYSSKSKTIENFKPINGSHTTSNNIGNNSNGAVFPMFKQPSYFFPPFPSPSSTTTATTFVIPPFPSVNSSSINSSNINSSNNNSNSLCNVNQQVDMMKSDNEYSSSSTTLSPLNQQTIDKSNHSIPIKKRSKKVNENSNQIVTTDEESTQKRPRKEGDEKERQKKERRLIRNRQSAQASRERKKQYIQSLEEKVSNLEEKVKLLEAENALLRRQVI